MQHQSNNRLKIALISIHGLIRGQNLELGRDADTGGQTLYVVQLAKALARHRQIEQVNLFTRLVRSDEVAPDYAQEEEALSEHASIVRIEAGPDAYMPKEKLWDWLDSFADNMADYFKAHGLPDILHSHYADAGYVGSRLANELGIPLIHTGHSLGRVKRHRLLAGGLSAEQIDSRYNMQRRIDAEEMTLASVDRVITSTQQEIVEQYDLYDHYQPELMRVVPPGTDLKRFCPPLGNEKENEVFTDLKRFLREPDKPIILGLSRPDRRKNIVSLIEAYGRSQHLQELANLVIVAGNRDDIEEMDEGIREVFHELFSAVDRYDLYGKVAMPKHHQRDQVATFYRLAALTKGVFVNPALTEPFGLTLIEAAACGVPIVATEDGGPVDIMKNCQNGFLIDPLDPETISSALLKLLTDHSLWQRCSEQGLKGVAEHYSWDAHAENYMPIVQAVVAGTEVLERQPMHRRRKLYHERAIFSDIDQNLLGDTEALDRLLSLLADYKKSTKFGIATGRRLDSALTILKKYNIPEPDILITSGGTEISYAPKLQTDQVWQKHIDHLWAPHQIRRILSDLPGIELQPRHEQSRFKISYYIDPNIAPSIDEINSLLHQEEQSVHVNVAFGQYLDIMPIRASKGLALRYVADRWQIPLERVFVAGGSGADEDMMRGNMLAAVVANRHHEELSQMVDVDKIYYSQGAFAAGILEALDHYDFFNRSAESLSEQEG